MNELFIMLVGTGLLFLLAILAAAVFPIWMAIDCATRKEVQNRPLWLLIILFGSGLGATIYYLSERREAKSRSPVTVITKDVKSDDARFENVFEKPPQ